MTDPTNLPRLYGEKEIGKILKRATELQHKEPSAPSAGSMSLQELEDIAAEAGIDPTYLRRAALEIDTGAMELSTWAKFLGEELLLVSEITIPGELRDDGFERIVEVIQRGTREHGQPSLLGRTMTWRAETPNKTRTIQITVNSRDGQTSVRLEENLTQFAGGLFGGTIAGHAEINVAMGGPGFGTHIVDVEVDRETGAVKVLRYTIIQDAGKAVFPEFVKGQFQGGAVQGIGMALNEEYIYDSNGILENPGFLDYRVPVASDVPNIDTEIVEVPHPGNPYGVRGVGEVPIIPPLAAISNAIHDAVGVRLRDHPMSPPKVLKALEEAAAGA